MSCRVESSTPAKILLTIQPSGPTLGSQQVSAPYSPASSTFRPYCGTRSKVQKMEVLSCMCHATDKMEFLGKFVPNDFRYGHEDWIFHRKCHVCHVFQTRALLGRPHDFERSLRRHARVMQYGTVGGLRQKNRHHHLKALDP